MDHHIGQAVNRSKSRFRVLINRGHFCIISLAGVGSRCNFRIYDIQHIVGLLAESGVQATHDATF